MENRMKEYYSGIPADVERNIHYQRERENIGKYLALILRHKPEVIGISLDEHGWGNVGDIIEGIRKQYPQMSMKLLEEIVATDSKGRYSFNRDKTCIRANQGHSIHVDVELKEAIPPDVLYHGTAVKYVLGIKDKGLIPKSRLYVHLSKDVDTAIKVGERHGDPVIFEVDTKQMIKDGYKFYLSENGVWLTKEVPVQYLMMKALETGKTLETEDIER